MGRRSKAASSPHATSSSFSWYVTFGRLSTLSLGAFLALYVVFLFVFLPLLHDTASDTLTPEQWKQKRFGGAFEGVRAPHLLRSKRNSSNLAKAASSPNKAIPAARSTAENDGEAIRNEKRTKARQESTKKVRSKEKERGGVVLLGMHRSGTSMLAGLLNRGLGYKVGAPLIGAAFDNERGFFELLPAVLQNDAFLASQGVWWAAPNILDYDHQRVLQLHKQNQVDFDQGTQALAFLNDLTKRPWMQKDPRMCITLSTWLPLLNTEPAILFTYRHPLEVAMSLKKREDNFTLERGLKLWMYYNMRAIQNSADLCRVTSSNNAILANPLLEVQRIADELSTKCNVFTPPHKLSQTIVEEFVDSALQHGKKDKTEVLKVLANFGDGCVANDYKSEYEVGSANRRRENKVYLTAMKIYCDFQSGEAYYDDYIWPKEDEMS